MSRNQYFGSFIILLEVNKEFSPTHAWQICRAGVNSHAHAFRAQIVMSDLHQEALTVSTDSNSCFFVGLFSLTKREKEALRVNLQKILRGSKTFGHKTLCVAVYACLTFFSGACRRKGFEKILEKIIAFIMEASWAKAAGVCPFPKCLNLINSKITLK